MSKLPIIISIPHASNFVPKEIKDCMALSEKEIMGHTDLATDIIFDIPKAHMVKAKISRLVVDVNRAPDDIEMECQLCAEGVVVSVSEEGKPIYKTPPDVEAIFERVDKYHCKFHHDIDELSHHMKFLIDGHSMKSVGPAMKPDAGKTRADVVLGNRDYTTCSRKTTLMIKNYFEKAGLSVKVNDPYKGKYVIGFHCSRRGLPGIQVEFNRKLYMNENTLKVHDKKTKELNQLMRDLVTLIDSELD